MKKGTQVYYAGYSATVVKSIFKRVKIEFTSGPALGTFATVFPAELELTAPTFSHVLNPSLWARTEGTQVAEEAKVVEVVLPVEPVERKKVKLYALAYGGHGSAGLGYLSALRLFQMRKEYDNTGAQVIVSTVFEDAIFYGSSQAELPGSDRLYSCRANDTIIRQELGSFNSFFKSFLQ